MSPLFLILQQLHLQQPDTDEHHCLITTEKYNHNKKFTKVIPHLARKISQKQTPAATGSLRKSGALKHV